jgi:hypothetical protein
MRDIIVPELRRRWPAARIVHELPLRYSTRRIDLAAITETEIIAVEIKSSRDTLGRLAAQIEGFLPISAQIIVALAPKWNAQLPMIEDARTGRGRSWSTQHTEAQQIIRDTGRGTIVTWTVCHAAQTITETEGGWSRNEMPWHGLMLDVLWVAELERVLVDHAVPGRLPSNHYDLVRACNDGLTGRQIVRAVCRALRARRFPQADEPIVRRVPAMQTLL